MKDYTRPRTNAQVLASRREDLRGVVRKMSIPNRCVWPECHASVWRELELPLCSTHSARVHLKVADALLHPETVSRPSSPDEYWSNPGFVYFAESRDMVKIGYSTDVPQRMKNLRSTTGHPHRLLAYTAGTRRDEKLAHFKFGEYWVEGEYFLNGDRLAAHIEELQRALDTRAN